MSPLAVDRLEDPLGVLTVTDARREALAEDVSVKSLVIAGAGFQSQIASRITSAEVTRTIEGASTLTIEVHDPDRVILTSSIIGTSARAVLDNLRFRLVGIRYDGDTLTLTFEDEDVWILRQRTSPRSVVRGKTTRAEFIDMMRREEKPWIRFNCPELHERQPIAETEEPDATDQDTARVAVAGKQPGFASDEVLTVKGRTANAHQREMIARVLTVGWKMKLRNKILIAAVMTIIQESEATNLSGGHGTSVGLFQIIDIHGSAENRRDPEWAARWFFTRAKAADAENPRLGFSGLAQAVQRSAYPNAYAQWEDESTEAVRAFLGGTSVASVSSTSSSEVKILPYFYSRGEPGGPKGEDSWSAMQRLATEVNWRAFIVANVLYYVSEERLFKQRPILSIAPNSPVLESKPSFEWDTGQKIAEAKLTVRAGRWVVPPGAVIVLVGLGPANGRWLVKDIRRSLFDRSAEITLVQPRPKLPEPANETETITTTDGQTITPDGDHGTSGLDSRIQKAYARARAIHNADYPYVWGGGHNSTAAPSGGGYDCSGAVSSVLNAAGVHSGSHVSGWFESWGASGVGQYMTVYANDDHVFIVFNLPGKGKEHFGTGRWGTPKKGPGFKPEMHHTSGFVARHIGGL